MALECLPSSFRDERSEEVSVSADDYVAFLEKMGHRVVVGRATYWFNSSPGIYMNFPFHKPAEPEPSEIRKVLGLRGLVARCACEVERGRPSYKIGCCDKDYDFSKLPQKGRNRTRRGLEQCTVRRLDFEELEPLGALELNRATFVRQQRHIRRDHDRYWRKYYSAAAGIESMEVWGAFVENDLAAYLIACSIEDCMNVLILRSSVEHLKDNPNNALMYAFVREIMSRPEMSEVSLGLEPVEPGLEDLDRFKTRMGFIKVPIGQRIYMNPLLRPLCQQPLLTAFQRIAAANHKSQKSRKFVGLMNWYSDQVLCKEASRP
jgi:hypothetical protein